MPSAALADRTAWELRALYQSGETAPTEVVRAVLDRIAAVEARLHAYLYIDRDAALREAAAWDPLAARPDAPPLAGIPVAIKDNICN